MTRFIRITLLACALILAVCAAPTQAQDSAIRSPHLGIDHISAPSDPIVDQRYRNALLVGAGWNRWPLYWNSVETSPGNYDWQGYDQLIANDVRYGLRTDAILLGTPAFDYDGGAIHGLYEAAFSDGSDTPGSGKQPNPANPYASFVYAAVMRYKPGGTLAAQLRWQPDQGIRVWEAWNEPDLRQFWSGSVEDYARLLKVTYLIVRAADPLAQVMFAGLAYNDYGADDYLRQTLDVIDKDPDRNAYNWYFDIAAVHSYISAERSGQVVDHAKQVLAAYGLDRPVWLNESGVPVWDDYPGPTWTVNDPAGHPIRGTMQEQALYMIESTAIAWAAGADVVFIFQLYDDCGNQPPGTTFAPNSGQAGDAYGLFRNDRSAPCFNQSPQPNTPRPATAALHQMAQIFGSSQFHGGTRVNLSGQGSVIAFDLSPAQGVASYGPVTAGGSGSNVSQRAYVMWNRSPDRLEVDIPASGSAARLYDATGEDYQLSPQDGIYQIGLPAVAAGDYPMLTPSEISHVSGAPYILIEQVEPGWTPVDPQMVHIEGEAVTTLGAPDVPTVTAAAIIPVVATPPPIPQPTVDVAQDTTPPIPLMQPLPEISPPQFTVRWSGLDNTGIASYIVWVRVDGGDWQKWLETSDVQADYDGTPGNTYEFALWAVDLAGNWSQNIELSPQAVTTVR